MPTLLNRKDLDAARCWRDHPPRIHDKKKRTIFELLGAGRTPTGMVSVTRWAPGDPDLAVGPLAAASRVRSSAGPMTYESPGPGTDVWHVNFADPELFAFYGGPAFA